MPKAYSNETDLEERKKKNIKFRNSGFLLYTSIALSYWAGAYRFLTAKVFVKEISVGFGLDVFFTIVFMILQIVNNVNLVETDGYKKYF